MNESPGFERDTHGWPLRPMLLAVVGALAALAVQLLLDRGPHFPVIDPAAGRIALTTAIGTGAVTFGFALERRRGWWAAAFGIGIGAVAGLIV